MRSNYIIHSNNDSKASLQNKKKTFIVKKGERNDGNSIGKDDRNGRSIVFSLHYFCFFKLLGIFGAYMSGLDALTNAFEIPRVAFEMTLAVLFIRFTSFQDEPIELPRDL